MYKPKILIDVNLEQSIQRQREVEREKAREQDRLRVRERQKLQKERYVREQAAREMSAINAEPIDSESSGGEQNFSPTNNDHEGAGSDSHDGMDVDELSRNSLLSNTPTTPNSPSANNSGTGGITGTGFSLNLNANRRKKIDVKAVFNMDDENEEVNGPAKRKLVPLGKLIS